MDLKDAIVCDILDVVTVFSKKGRLEEMSNRKSYGISFTLDGQITYTQNGVSYVEDRNHAVLLPKNQSYTIRGDVEGTFPVINFDTTEFLTDTITVLPIDSVDFIYKEFEQMKNLSFSKNNRLAVMSIFYSILSAISHNSLETNSLSPAIKYIENNLQQDITNRDLADTCGLCEEYFRKLFKTTLGISPKQYITNMRIGKAKKLLKEGSLKISEISEQCGFSNQYHFCRYFKKKVGLTPTEYSKQNRILKI